MDSESSAASNRPDGTPSTSPSLSTCREVSRRMKQATLKDMFKSSTGQNVTSSLRQGLKFSFTLHSILCSSLCILWLLQKQILCPLDAKLLSPRRRLLLMKTPPPRTWARRASRQDWNQVIVWETRSQRREEATQVAVLLSLQSASVRPIRNLRTLQNRTTTCFLRTSMTRIGLLPVKCRRVGWRSPAIEQGNRAEVKCSLREEQSAEEEAQASLTCFETTMPSAEEACRCWTVKNYKRY